MRNIIGCFMGIIFLMFIANSASAGQVYNWQAVNWEVAPTVSKPAPEAFLKVYTEVQEVDDQGYIWHLHLPYTIYSADGKKVNWIKNDDVDHSPNLISLPPGKYVIVPDVTFTKKQIVGATLELGKLTEIHLMGG